MPKKLQNLALRVMAEYASSGIWVIGKIGVFRHGMINHAALNLPVDLAQGFDNWIEWYYDNAGIDGAELDTDAFNAEGLRLARALKTVLGSDVYVEFIPETATGGLGEPQIITLNE